MKIDHKRGLLLKVCIPFLEGLASENNPWKDIELGLHEMCHAALLDIPLGPKAPVRVSDYFDGLMARNPILALVEEAQCFAVEKMVIRALGIGKHINLDRSIRDVWENGTAGPALPFPMFKSIIRRSGREIGTAIGSADAARVVIHYLYRKGGIAAVRPL